MKDHVMVSAVQFAPEWLDRDRNAARMAEWASTEAAGGAELVVFPELSNVGFVTPVMIGDEPSFDDNTSALDFLVKYKKAAEPIPGPTTNLLSQVTRKAKIYIVVGMAQSHPTVSGTLYNAAVLIGPSGIIGVQHKIHIPNYERWYFYPGAVPQVFDTELGKIGMSICYDGHFFPEVNRSQALQGAEIMCEVANVGQGRDAQGNIPGQHFPMERIAYTRALENACYYVHLNRSGIEGRSIFIGHSAIAAPDGSIIASTDGAEEVAITADMANDELLYARSTLAVYRDRRPDVYGPIVEPLSRQFMGQTVETLPQTDIGGHGVAE